MSTIVDLSLPRQEKFAINAPLIPHRNLSYLGRFVEWVSNSDGRSCLEKLTVQVFAMFICIALVLSVVGLFFVIAGAQEVVRQQDRKVLDEHDTNLRVAAKERGYECYKIGRARLFDYVEPKLAPATRQEILADLQVPEEQKDTFTDRKLIQSAAIDDEELFRKYNLNIVDPRLRP